MVGGFPIYVLIQKLQFQKINCLLNQNILNLELVILEKLKKSDCFDIKVSKRHNNS